ncbi:MAG: porin [Burkholderiales bacterium]|nr:porin [Burkholderiales bacterium]
MFNKKLLTLAVTGALAAPGVALAQATNVQLYGVLDLAYANMKFSQGTAAASVGITKNQLRTSAPRWGVRGTEDLGGGLQAYFQLEAGVALDGRGLSANDASGIYALGGRDVYVGLRNRSWGSFQAGSFGSAYSSTTGVWSVIPTFGHGGIIMGVGNTTGTVPSPNCTGLVSPASGAIAAGPVCVGGPVESSTTSFNRRQSQYVQYESPNLGGFVGRLGYAFDPREATSTAAIPNVHAKLWSLSATWSGGPFAVTGGYESHRGYGGANGAGGVVLTNVDPKDTAWTLGGRWNFGMGTVGAGWERMSYGNAAATGAAANDYKRDAWVVNASFNVGRSGVIGAGYSKTSGFKSCGAARTDAAAATACGGSTAAKILSLSYDHNLSKRTALYAAYGKIDNNNFASYYYIAGPASNSGGGAAAGVPAGTDVTTLQVGVKHSF